MDPRLALHHGASSGASVISTAEIPSGDTIMTVAWDSGILDSMLAVAQLAERTFKISNEAREAFAESFGSTNDDGTPYTFEEVLASKMADCSLATFLLQRADGRGSSEVKKSNLDWIHGVVESCGPDLGIPLAISASSLEVLGLDFPQLMLTVLPQNIHVVIDLHASPGCVVSSSTAMSLDTSTLINDRAAVARWFALCQKFAMLGDSGSVELDTFTRYVAWIRSRWISCRVNVGEEQASLHQQQGTRTSRKKKTKEKKPRTMEVFAIVPVVEKLNHSPHSLMNPSVEWGVRVTLEAAHSSSAPRAQPLLLPSGPSSTRGPAAAALLSGDEVLINYGALSNSKLLTRYGFVLEGDCPAEYVAVSLPPIGDTVRERWRVYDGTTASTWTIRHGQQEAEHTHPPWDVMFTMLLALFGEDASVAAAAEQALPHMFEGTEDIGEGDEVTGSVALWDNEGIRTLLLHLRGPVAEALCNALRSILSMHVKELERAAREAERCWRTAQEKELPCCASFFFWAVKYANVKVEMLNKALAGCSGSSLF